MTLLIAHRGVSYEAPENTLSAISRAIDLRTDWIEVDLHITKDGVPVVIHDSSLMRTTNNKDPVCVEDLTLAELKKLDAGSWFSPSFAGEQIPTLEEVLALDRKGVKLMLEIKKGRSSAEELCSKILSVLPSQDESIILGSFEPDIMSYLLTTKYSVIGIIEESRFIETFLQMGIKHLALWSKILEPRLTERLHEQGVMVWVFTVDDLKTAEFLKALGVDGIISNNPRFLREHVLSVKR